MITGKVGDACYIEQGVMRGDEYLTALTRGTVFEIHGRVVRVRLADGTTTARSYVAVAPAAAVTRLSPGRFEIQPYRWEGVPQGAWACDTQVINVEIER